MKIIYHNNKKTSKQTENPYWMSFSDMMSGILIIFILVCSALVYQLSETKEKIHSNIWQLEKSIRIRNNMLKEIKTSLASKGINVEVDDDTVIVPEKTLDFDSGSFDIKNDNKEAAILLGKKISNALKKEERWKLLETVFIEGHTDSLSADKSYRKGNWELSALRAISLWEFWTVEHYDDFGKDFLNMKENFFDGKIMKTKSLFSVSGYADTRRREMEDNTEEHRRKNRRIEIRFIIKSITPAQLKKIREPLIFKEHNNESRF